MALISYANMLLRHNLIKYEDKMSFLISTLTVLFAILCVLLIIVVLLQSDKSAGMGILGGASQSTFGSSTADVITKITTFMVVFFMVGSLGLSILESKHSSSLKADVMGTTKPETGLQKEPIKGQGQNYSGKDSKSSEKK